MPFLNKYSHKVHTHITKSNIENKIYLQSTMVAKFFERGPNIENINAENINAKNR